MSYWMMLRRKRLIASSGLNIAKLAITYSAEDGMTDEIVTMSDGEYRLLTLTKSGTLTIPKEVTADVWLCGGGSNGYNWTGEWGGIGGGGGYINSSYGIKVKEAITTVGAAKGTSAFNDISAAGATNHNGSSGGGGRYWSSPCVGSGTGDSTYPFEDTTYFSGKPHCAGGGGGGTYYDGIYTNGGKGGSNGSNGVDGVTTSNYGMTGGAGGSYGGGKGGNGTSTPTAGASATFYGSGGGGTGAYRKSEDRDWKSSEHGSGYQGVIYVRIPLKQTA